MATELDRKAVAEWHRNEAKKLQELANFHKKTADAIDSGTVTSMSHAGGGEQEEWPVMTAKRNLTLEQLQKELKKKRGRVVHVAKRLNMFPIAVENLLKDPTSEYVVGPRGFIYRKDDSKYLAMMEKAE